MKRSGSRVLVVDDEKNILTVLQAMLSAAQYETVTCQDPQLALEILDDEDVSAVITDLNMPGTSGLQVLEYCKQHHPRVPVIIITAYATVDAAVTALKTGAFDFISKPFDRDELLKVVAKAVQTHVKREQEPMPEVSAVSPALTGNSQAVLSAQKLIERVAPTPAHVLITGEVGTGKEQVAREIHLRSRRAASAFIRLNCGAIPSELMEAELFGSDGVLSPARPGRVELANGGTLFLDEVTELSADLQLKLLRLLNEGTYEPVGGVRPQSADVRVVVGAPASLEKDVKEGRFNFELYDRLSVAPLVIAPLRERRGDIRALSEKLREEYNQKLGRQVSGIQPEALSALESYSWPGNQRQLENVLERMVLMTEGPLLSLRDLPDEILRNYAKHSGQAEVEDVENFKEEVRRKTRDLERDLIQRALKANTGNVTRTAEQLGLSRKGLQLKMKELGIKRYDE